MELEYSMLFRMIQISENVKKLSTDIVFETLKYDIPDLLERLSSIEEIQPE